MIIEVLLGIIFVGSTGVLWYLVSQKLPELIAIPDQVIVERLHESSTKFHLFLLHFKSFFREGHYKTYCSRLKEKFLHRLHIVLMKMDHAVTMSLQRTRAQLKNGETAESAAHILHRIEIPQALPAPVSAVAAAPEELREVHVAIAVEEPPVVQWTPVVRKITPVRNTLEADRFVPIQGKTLPRISRQTAVKRRTTPRRSKIIPSEIK